MRVACLIIAAALLSATSLLANDTEVVLEHGKLEVQLKNDVFINLNPGADIAIRHDDDGAPLSIDVRAGEIQFLSGFSGDDDFDIRVGAHALRMGRGSAILSVARDGGFRAVMLDGARLRMLGRADSEIGPGERLRLDGSGKLFRENVNPEEMRGLRQRFIKRLRRGDADRPGGKGIRKALADPDKALRTGDRRPSDATVEKIKRKVKEGIDGLPPPPPPVVDPPPPPPPGPPPPPPPLP